MTAVTDWFAGDVWPVRPGWYEVTTPSSADVIMCLFNGQWWSLLAPSEIDTRIIWGSGCKWRGLAKQPEFARWLELPKGASQVWTAHALAKAMLAMPDGPFLTTDGSGDIRGALSGPYDEDGDGAVWLDLKKVNVVEMP